MSTELTSISNPLQGGQIASKQEKDMSQYKVLCLSSHPMTYWKMRAPTEHPQGPTGMVICDNCAKEYLQQTQYGFWHCVDCSYDLCVNCANTVPEEWKTEELTAAATTNTLANVGAVASNFSSLAARGERIFRPLWNDTFFSYILDKKSSMRVTCLSIVQYAGESGEINTWIITGCLDASGVGLSIAWDFETGRMTQVYLKAHQREVTSQALFVAGDGNIKLITAGLDGLVVIWDALTAQVQMVLNCDQVRQGFKTVAYFQVQSGIYLLGGGADGVGVIWNLQSGSLYRLLVGGHGLDVSGANLDAAQSAAVDQFKAINCIKGFFAADGLVRTCVVTASNDTSIAIWSFDTGQLLHKIVGVHKVGVSSFVIYSPPDWPSDKSVIVAGSGDGKVSVVSLSTFRTIRLLEEGHTNQVTSVHVEALNNRPSSEALIFSAAMDNTVVIWLLSTGEKIRTITGANVGGFTSVKVLQNQEMPGRYNVLAGCNIGLTLIWDIGMGRVDNLLYPIMKPHNKESNTAIAIAGTTFYKTPDTSEKMLLTAASDMTIVSTSISTQIQKFKSSHIFSNTTGVRVTVMTVFSPKDVPSQWETPWCVAGMTDGSIIVWKINKPNEIVSRMSNGHSGSVIGLSVHEPLSSDYKGKQAWVISGGMDMTTIIWQITDGKMLRKLVGHKSVVSSVISFVPQEKQGLESWVFTGSYDCSVIVDKISPGEVGSIPKTIIRDYYNGQHKQPISSIKIYTPPNGATNESLLITASHEGYCVLWDLSTREVKGKLSGGHTSRIDCMDIYYPPENAAEGRTEPVLVTGGCDGIICCWLFYNQQKLINRIEDNSNGAELDIVNTIVFNGDGVEEPMVVVIKKLGSVETWRLFPITSAYYIPTSSIITSKFLLDLPNQSIVDSERTVKSSWMQMNIMVENYGWVVLFETPSLFHQAVQNGRSDFLFEFLPVASLGTLRLLLSSSLKNPSLLITLINRKDLEGIKFFLSICAEKLLNISINNDIGAFVFHAFHLICIEDFMHLSEYYPQEFYQFIYSLKVLESPEIVYEGLANDRRRCSFETNEMMVGVSKEGLAHNINNWEKYILNNQLASGLRTSDLSPITACFLPFINAGSMDMINVYVRVCNKLNNVNIFNDDCPIGVIGMKVAWTRYGRKLHVTSMLVYLSFVMMYTFATVFFVKSSQGVGTFLEVIVLLYLLFYLWVEIRRIRFVTYNKAINQEKLSMIALENNPLLLLDGTSLQSINDSSQNETWLSSINSYFSTSNWKGINVITFMLVFLGTCTRLHYQVETVASSGFLCVGTIFVYFRILYYLQAYESTGPLVAMIFVIAYGIRHFLLVLFIVNFGFSIAFWQISYPDFSLPFGTIANSLMSSFQNILGNYTLDFGGPNEQLGIVLWVAFVMIVSILMLNLLIAIMADSYSEVRAKGLAQWRYDQANIFLEQKFLLESFMKRSEEAIVHILIKTADMPQPVEPDPTEIIIKNLEEKLNNKIEELNSKVDMMAKALSTGLEELKTSLLLNNNNEKKNN
eukprot:gene12448-16696_t